MKTNQSQILEPSTSSQLSGVDEPIPSLLTYYCTALVNIARDNSIDLDKLSAEIGIDLNVEDNVLAQYHFTPEHHALLVASLTATLNDEFLGSTSYRAKPGTYKLVFEILTACETLGDAIDRCCKLYAAITDDIQFSLTDDGIMAVLDVRVDKPDVDRYFYTRESIMRGFHRLFSALISVNIPLHDVSFTHQCSVPAIEYTRVFHCPCSFSQPAQTLRFDKRYLDYRVRIDPNNWHIIWQTSQYRAHHWQRRGLTLFLPVLLTVQLMVPLYRLIHRSEVLSHGDPLRVPILRVWVTQGCKYSGQQPLGSECPVGLPKTEHHPPERNGHHLGFADRVFVLASGTGKVG